MLAGPGGARDLRQARQVRERFRVRPLRRAERDAQGVRDERIPLPQQLQLALLLPRSLAEVLGGQLQPVDAGGSAEQRAPQRRAVAEARTEERQLAPGGHRVSDTLMVSW